MRRFVLAALAALALPLFGTEPNPSQEQRVLIEKLLVLTKADQNARAMTDAIFAQIEKQFVDEATVRGNDEESLGEARELFQSFRTEAAKIDFGELMNDAFIRIYAKYFSEAEIRDLIAFYSSPTGRKSIDVLDDLMREGMQVGVERVAPKLDEILARVRREHEKKRPWRQTMEDIRSVATALEAYAIDHDDRYPNVDYAGLEALLAPTYLREFPKDDMWGHAYAYASSPDGSRYRLVSAGADAIFEWDSRRVTPLKEGETEPVRYRDRLEDDIVFADGSFVQLPQQAKPRD